MKREPRRYSLCLWGLMLWASLSMAQSPAPVIKAPKILAALKTNPSAKSVSFEELKQFLLARSSSQKFFRPGFYEGPQFAVDLFNEAHQGGIACEYIALRLGVDSEFVDHAAIKFVTKDRGEMYVDTTPILVDDKQIFYGPRFVWVAVGDELMSVDVKNGPDWFVSKKFFFESHQMKNLVKFESALKKSEQGIKALKRFQQLQAREIELKSLLTEELEKSKDPKDRALRSAYRTELTEIYAENAELQKLIQAGTPSASNLDFKNREDLPRAATLGSMSVRMFQKLDVK